MSDIDAGLIEQVSRASDETRAEIAALVNRGKVRAFSPHFAVLGTPEQTRLSRGVAEMMRCRGEVISATGISAALAMNWAEAHGVNYTLTKRGETYVVQVVQ